MRFSWLNVADWDIHQIYPHEYPLNIMYTKISIRVTQPETKKLAMVIQYLHLMSIALVFAAWEPGGYHILLRVFNSLVFKLRSPFFG